jgi:hypothetical protein
MGMGADTQSNRSGDAQVSKADPMISVMNYLSLADENGNVRATVPIDTNGGVVRVAVGEVGKRSEVWRIWANKRTSDVYVAARKMAQVQKFSLHESGRWRYAFTEQGASHLPEGTDRAIDKWTAKEADEGFLAALAIEIRAQDVIEFPDDMKADDVHWIEPPPEGHYVSIRLSFLTPDAGVYHPLGGNPIEAIGLADNRALIVAYQVEPILALRWDNMEAARRRVLDGLRFSQVMPGQRLAVFSNDENGIRYVFDTAVHPHELLGPRR